MEKCQVVTFEESSDRPSVTFGCSSGSAFFHASAASPVAPES